MGRAHRAWTDHRGGDLHRRKSGGGFPPQDRTPDSRSQEADRIEDRLRSVLQPHVRALFRLSRRRHRGEVDVRRVGSGGCGAHGCSGRRRGQIRCGIPCGGRMRVHGPGQRRRHRDALRFPGEGAPLSWGRGLSSVVGDARARRLDALDMHVLGEDRPLRLPGGMLPRIGDLEGSRAGGRLRHQAREPLQGPDRPGGGGSGFNSRSPRMLRDRRRQRGGIRRLPPGRTFSIGARTL